MTKKDLHTKTLEQLLREKADKPVLRYYKSKTITESKDDTHPEGIQGSAPTSLNLQGRFD